ncbi:RecQ family ATP-dependent DNA helicase [Subsaximicrobium wynnwilliamsii]|uniref:DNA 3'-5' helicase n=2 Tax=Subsaximicrobium wynnwilliamsii TaxID=291179 RepID=A0A5C6ZGJ2_9FLAO|nr:RecQ family ATP-dependent DNA helicase [Subsaximicrobium wynnwilliamsii]TXD83230.1 RecQ family ATP-dependent DNA helicase [Subsaximicrobium wynnwilliamsii]TXD88343.1 RecQ family ATP-dependent DNA helicase [Subsaximicrobium wynnwilliamsii]TXE03064.1 RecQ family ATP-dependent DNA helicase [Subsaximicrobium wynnwilliamsii]
MNKVLYIDIETTKQGKIKDIGALFNGQELHESQFTKLKSWIHQAEYICGHNIVAHDIPLLERVLGNDIFKHKKIVDTLLWSTLLFCDNPYHKLVKGYKIVNDSDYNNPLSDCKLTRQLLIDELNRFKELEENVQQIYVRLLTGSDAYSGFLELIDFQMSNLDAATEIVNLFKSKICDSSNIFQLVKEYPIELAYAFSLINTKEDKSVLAYWVSNTLPKTQEILDNVRFKFCGKETCTYCNSYLNPKKALQSYFGYEDFRSFDPNEDISLQEKTVRAGLSARSFVAVFPTGGGKSLTFQLPALMKGSLSRQLTVVISPLVSLMKDQVENLENRFDITKAAAINGLLSPLERQDAIERVEKGGVQLLYLSPESLRSPTILRILKQRSIARFVIDEAHCFSSWGQDFRVDYLFIADFILSLEEERPFGKIPVSCFTATAKPQVIEDIKKYFKIKLNIELDEYVTRATRTNLKYEVIEIKDSDHKMNTLLSVLENCEKPVIIYASRTKRVEEIHGLIQKAGLSSTYFHGRLDKEVKKDNMDSFMHNEKDIIVATSAFGMGVDKDDVKSVIHYNISDSLENYVQEAGRAGRDEKIQAKCYILFNEQDLSKHFSLLQQTKINQKEIQQIWQALKNLSKYRKEKKISNSALEIAQKAGWDTEIQELETRVKTSIAALEDQGFLKRRLNSPMVFADSLLVPNLSKALKIINQSKNITEIQVQNCSRILQRIVKDDECRIDYLADRTGLRLKEIRDVIELLRELKILGDAKDLTAFINLTQSAKSSRKTLDRYRKIETAMHQILTGDIKISMRQLNQNINDLDVKSEIHELRNILNYWELRNFIQKKRVDRENDLYQIKIKHYDSLNEDIKWRHELTLDVYELLEKFYLKQKENRDSQDKKDLPVSFSMLELKNSNQLFGQIKEEDIKRYEKTLLFLNQIKSIKLEGGFMVSYNRLNIEDIDRSLPRFTLENFNKMSQHYLHKTEQIHIVGEYAKRRLKNYESALAYVNDYFSQPYEEFLAKYFPRRKMEISRPVTPERFKKIAGELDIDQRSIVDDNKSDNILVLAGPGSGKTKVLVHKIASLLLLEDIKPEQFLMLTFSKAASLEFRARARELVPEYTGLIKITTFHGFCFQLLGQLGDLKKSENVIQDCITAINNKEVDISSIINKSVLLLDEFQDVNAVEWKLVQTIINKAKNIRVIAVGDDDQNIYGFRGSSNKNMLEFREKYNATSYALIKNYRSSSHIVHFNNALLKKIPNRLKTQALEPIDKTLKSNIKLIRYNTSYLEKSLAEKVIQDNYVGTRAILVRTNKQALMLNTFLKEFGQKTKLITGLEGFSLDHLFELRTFTDHLKLNTNDAGLIFNTEWADAKNHFVSKHDSSSHLDICLKLIQKFELNYNKQKQLIDWYDYIREIKMEDAIDPDSKAIIIATLHKSKGKEFDHVYLLLEDYDFAKTESKRVLYVGCSRAKLSLQLHCNSSFFDEFDTNSLSVTKFEGTTEQPKHFEVILGHKDIYLGSQKYSKTVNRINTLKSGDQLINDSVQFTDNIAIGCAKQDGGNVLLFSRDFMAKKHDTFIKDGYQLANGSVAYLVYWFDAKEGKEYKVVLPKLMFEKR